MIFGEAVGWGLIGGLCMLLWVPFMIKRFGSIGKGGLAAFVTGYGMFVMLAALLVVLL